MIELIATVQSLSQAEALLEVGVDTLYFGQDEFGLRLGHSFSREDQARITQLAHAAERKVTVALNAIFHNEGIDTVPEYLAFLKSLGVDSVTLGDPGVVQKMKKDDLFLPFRFDAQVTVTNSRQVNFWAQRGAIAAVLAREIPKAELEKIAQSAVVPVEVLVYGATCIHQSRRPLLANYFNYIAKQESVGRNRGLFLSEPMKKDSHYSIYEDGNGTHIFANNDLLMAQYLGELTAMGVGQWKLDGLFTYEADFVAVAGLFAQARDVIEAGQWDKDQAMALEAAVRALHPTMRGLDTGFYLKDPEEVV